MENLTNQVLELKSGKKYFVIRQAAYRGNTYFLAAVVTPDEEAFTNEFTFLERVDKDSKFFVKKVTDDAILNVLTQNIKLN